jgi:hypothetical protein
MFKPGYSAEKDLKKLARIIYIVCRILFDLSIVAAVLTIVTVGINVSFLTGLISGVSVLGGGLAIYGGGIISALMVWGFSEIIGNTKGAKSNEEVEDLPEL